MINEIESNFEESFGDKMSSVSGRLYGQPYIDLEQDTDTKKLIEISKRALEEYIIPLNFIRITNSDIEDQPMLDTSLKTNLKKKVKFDLPEDEQVRANIEDIVTNQRSSQDQKPLSDLVAESQVKIQTLLKELTSEITIVPVWENLKIPGSLLLEKMENDCNF